MDNADKNWTLFADRHFHDFEELVELIRGWDLDFRQLKAGRSPAGLLQFGSPDLVVSRFCMSQPYDQRGSAPPGMLTLGFVEEGGANVVTPEGTITENELLCFSAGREFACASQAEFRACSISLSESLLDEAADICELSDAQSAVGSARIVRCRQRANIDRLRNHLGRLSRGIRNGETALRYPRQAHELELDLARQVLEALAGPPEVMPLRLTNRKRLVLRRSLDYLEANPGSPITVYELAQVAGAGVRTLEYMFRDYFGVTPKAYLTSRRLIGARRELQRSDTDSTSVRDVAYSWGFWHLSRFAQDYKRFFGELPSQTLGSA